MASFQFVDSAARAYSFAWTHKSWLLRLIAVPVLVKAFSLIALTFMDWGDNVLRAGLVMIPGNFTEGWAVALAMGYALQEDSKTKRPPVVNAVLASAIIYLLTQMALAFISGLILAVGGPDLQPNPATQQSPVHIVLSVAMLITFLWGFRLMWLHVPVILGQSLVPTLRHIRAYSSSFQMMGIWLLCFVPAAMVLIVIVAGLINTDDHVMDIPTVISLVLRAIFEVLIGVVSSIGMAYGLQAALKGPADTRVLS